MKVTSEILNQEQTAFLVRRRVARLATADSVGDDIAPSRARKTRLPYAISMF